MSANITGNPPDKNALGSLATEQVNQATVNIDLMSPLEIVTAINAEDAKVALAIQQELPQIAQAISAIAERLRQGGRLIYSGAGTSGRLGILDASECPPTFSTPLELVIGVIAGGGEAVNFAKEGAEDDEEAGREDLQQLGLNPHDAVVGIAASGRTPYVLAALDYARAQGALTIGLACNANTPMQNSVEIMIAPAVGPEVISGSTRLKAGTAQKMVLNMLSTGTMILLGKTYGNLMVDLRATNYKLHKRAAKIVEVAAHVDGPTAERLLQECNGEAKTAIVVGRLPLTPQEARERLALHNDNLRAALGEV